VRFNDLIYSEIAQENYPILVEVSKMIASHQIRNLATIGGNLCNAAPSADSAPILIVLDSKLTITGPKNKTRTLSMEQFFTGPGTTALKPGELLNRIQIPPIKPNTGMAYIKHTTRKALEIAVVGVAGLIQLDKGTDKCTDAKVVVAACAPTPLRVPGAEEILIGKNVTDRILNTVADAAASAVKPISDVRGSENYRREMVKIQCKRVLEKAHFRAKKAKRIKPVEVES
jgi:carbon-monoxide dehydrogenase medium subunit